MTRTKCTFIADEQKIQLGYFEKHLKEWTGHRGRAFQLRPEHKYKGLLPALRETAPALFKALKIQWHPFVGHGRSSQAACVNFLLPLADGPDLLSRWTGALLGIDPPEMLALEKEQAAPHLFVAFEYTGPGDRDWLGEAEGGVPQRGAHATAADAAIAFRDAEGRRHLLLIEWKYSEEYRNHRLSADRSNKRVARYSDKAFAPNGPIRADLGLKLTDFFHEPFYQLLRQQMLAWRIERSGLYHRARVLHLSPAGNRALHQVTAPALCTVGGVEHTDAFAAYRAALADPDAFIARSIESAFAPLAGEAEWFEELRDRYPTLCGQGTRGVTCHG